MRDIIICVSKLFSFFLLCHFSNFPLSPFKILFFDEGNFPLPFVTLTQTVVSVLCDVVSSCYVPSFLQVCVLMH